MYDPHDEAHGPHLVQVPTPDDEEWLVVPTVDLRCVGRTTARRRCRNRVMDSRADRVNGGLSLRWSTRGMVYVYEMFGSADAVRAWREQRCPVHDTLEAVDECAVEWRLYDPERDAAFFAMEIPPLPRLPEPGQEWSEVPDWIRHLWRIGHEQRQYLGMPAGASYVPGQGWTP